jgi:hypothetical protein
LGLSQVEGAKFNRFAFEIKAGTAVPVGVYANSSTDQLIRENPFDPNREVVGVFTKNGNGFARPGQFFEGSLSYRFSKGLFAGVIGQRFENPINLNPVNDFLTEVDPNFNMVQNEYQGTLFGPRIGIGKTKGAFQYNVSQAFGWSKLEFPIFEMSYGENVPWVFTHFFDYEPIESWFSKTEVTISYRLSPWIRLGGDLSFVYSDFNYSLTLTNVPGGSGFYQYYDTVNLRLLNLGLHIGVEF